MGAFGNPRTDSMPIDSHRRQRATPVPTALAFSSWHYERTGNATISEPSNGPRFDSLGRRTLKAAEAPGKGAPTPVKG